MPRGLPSAAHTACWNRVRAVQRWAPPTLSAPVRVSASTHFST